MISLKVFMLSRLEYYYALTTSFKAGKIAKLENLDRSFTACIDSQK